MSGASNHAVPGLRRNMVTICAMTATIMQALDTTIANVALRYISGGLAVGPDEAAWVVTSYLVANAIEGAAAGHPVPLAQLVEAEREYHKQQAERFAWLA